MPDGPGGLYAHIMNVTGGNEVVSKINQVNMRKKIIFLLAALLMLGAQNAFAQMSDDQIINYITAGVAAGKTERQIGSELMAKGVTTLTKRKMARRRLRACLRLKTK